MAPRKSGALEGEEEAAFRKPCQHLLDFKAKKGAARAFKQLQSAGIINRKGSKQVLKCAVCRRTCSRLLACLVCANVGCWDSFPSSPNLSHAMAHAHLHPDHCLAIDLPRAELFCCVCADQVYDSDFDHFVICSQLPSFKHRPKRIVNGIRVELSNRRETRSNKKKQDCHFAKSLLSNHASQVNGEDSSLPSGLRGLNNLGNTCFMNCILQALLHIRPLQNFFLNDGHNRSICQEKGSHSCLGCEMHAIYSAAFSGDRSPFSPAQFLCSWWQHAANLAGYKQQDAHEFFISAIDGFHATLANAVKSGKSKSAGDGDCKCIAHHVFSGLLRSDVSCTVCGFSSTAHDPCIDISLDLEPSSAIADMILTNGHSGRSSRGAQTTAGANAGATLYGCLDRFTRPERLGHGEKFYCQNCKEPQDSVKQMSVKKLPLVLCLHIKRFEHSVFSNVSRKLDRYVQFPFSLSMASFLSSSVVRLRHGNRLVAEHDEVDVSCTEFELLAVVTHSGKLDSGHYITYLQLGGLWYRCDDSWVSKASEDVVRACQAYMLFYVQKDRTIDE
ncbi:hypothetical protein GOP47_0017268 [Adiantum capillus-veneris]|uniref:Ubiquitin carboxyl-terminal hydrolase n=1 Tax=Adiantum capillus-veneris TaxID=13818 RepID=A0A9D4UF41_ADICA|nr:hypothetical protein GOP47_0017268 [Adiantum capillus-veneris]